MTLLLGLIACSPDKLDEDRVPDPELALLSPGPASWLPTGDGQASGTCANVESLTLNGNPTDCNEGAFVGRVTLERGINVIEALGTAPDGEYRYERNGVISGSFADPGHAVEDAADLRVNTSGLDKAMDWAAGMVDQPTIAAAATGMNPVYEDTYGVWGWDAVTISADIDDITFSPVELKATPGANLLELEAVIPDLFVDLQAYGEVVYIDFDVDASVAADAAVVTGWLMVDVTDQGDLSVELVDASVELQNFSYDTSLLPGDVESYLFVDTIRGVLEDMLVDQIKALVPGLLESQLAGLDLSFDLELLGVPLAVSADFASASIDKDGIALTTDITVDAPGNGAHTYTGYLSAPSTGATVSTKSDLSGSLHDDLLNRVLFEVWRAGIADMTLSTYDGSLEPLMLIPLKAEEGSITLNPLLPPVIVESNGSLELQLGELEVILDTPGGELGEYLRASVNVFAPIEVFAVGGVMKMDIGDPELVIMVRESDWGAEEVTVTELLEQALPIDALLAVLNIEYALPSLAFLTIDTATTQRDGFNTTLEINLK